VRLQAGELGSVGRLMNAITWPWITWRALPHVTRDALLYAAEEPIGIDLIQRFVDDALGASAAGAAKTVIQNLLARDLVMRSTLSSGEPALTLTPAGLVWVQRYYSLIEDAAGTRPAPN
jgi:hypothetical protein